MTNAKVFFFVNGSLLLAISVYYFQSMKQVMFSEDYPTHLYLISNNVSDNLLARISEKNSTEYWLSEQEHNGDLLNSECPQLKIALPENLKKSFSHNLLVDDIHKIIYCYVPKVACTQWKKIMMVLAGTAPKGITDPEKIPDLLSHYKNGLKSLISENYKKEDVELRLKTYTKFMIVRHPLERLFSAFKNKFVQKSKDADNFRRAYARKMMAFARKVPLSEVPANGTGMIFSEFLFYLGEQNPKVMQEHWKPMHELCHPCEIQYDFIGKFESLERDSNEILNQINSSLTFPSYVTSSTPRALKDEMSSVSGEIINKIYEKFKLDWTLFDYQHQYK